MHRPGGLCERHDSLFHSIATFNRDIGSDDQPNACSEHQPNAGADRCSDAYRDLDANVRSNHAAD